MGKLGWIVFSLLAINALVACWMTWRRYSRASELDTTVTGLVVSAKEGSGRAPADFIVAKYTVGGKTFTRQGSSNDSSSLTAKRFPVDSEITVYVSSKDPSISSLSPGAGYHLVGGAAVLLLLASGVVAYFAFFKRT